MINLSFYTKEDDLTKRSLNILNMLGGTESMLLHYKTHKSFLNIRKSGKFVNNELSSYCEFLLKKEQKGNLYQLPESPKNIIPKDDEINFENLAKVYQKEKDRLSTRSLNCLFKLEKENYFELDFDYKILFFESYFLSDFKFKSIRNIGSITIKELESLRKVLKLNLIVPKKIKEFTLSDKLYSLFEGKFTHKQLADLVNDEGYYLKNTIILYLYFIIITEKQRNLFDCFYNKSQAISFRLIGKNLNCSYEHVRTMFKKYNSYTIPKSVVKIKSIIGKESFDMPLNIDCDYFNVCTIEKFEFIGQQFEPNIVISKIINQFYYIENYLLIDELIVNPKSFNFNELILFISKEFVKETDLKSLFAFLDDEIYNFEVVDFQYSLNILINRFYKENNQELSKNKLSTIYNIVEKVKKTDWQIDSIKIRKLESKEYKDKIVDNIIELLSHGKIALKTNDILNDLIKNHISIEKLQLLKILNTQKSTFFSFGHGMWGLSDWNINLKLKGSIREIVEDILLSNKEPVHISELLNFINKIRPITKHSLDTNLRTNENKLFIFFNCSYIGLHNKKYDDYWYKIPKFSPLHIIRGSIKLNLFQTIEDEIDLISEKYGYPKQHLKYIFSLRKK